MRKRIHREHSDRIFAIGKQGNIRTQTLANGGVQHLGTVATIFGYVVIDSHLLENGAQGTNLEIIHERKICLRYYEEHFYPYALVRLANQLAADVVAGRFGAGE